MYIYQYKLKELELFVNEDVCDTGSLVCLVGLSARLGFAAAGRFADSPAAAGWFADSPAGLSGASRRFGGWAATSTSGPKLRHFLARLPTEKSRECYQ